MTKNEISYTKFQMTKVKSVGGMVDAGSGVFTVLNTIGLPNVSALPRASQV